MTLTDIRVEELDSLFAGDILCQCQFSGPRGTWWEHCRRKAQFRVSYTCAAMPARHAAFICGPCLRVITRKNSIVSWGNCIPCGNAQIDLPSIRTVE